MQQAHVVFVRHGQSEFNKDQKFTGWTDVDLTSLGREEAAAAADAIMRYDIEFDVALASQLTRAQETMSILLEEAGQNHLDVIHDWRLNERHYGALEGTSKDAAVERYGQEQVKLWRNSYSSAPPPLTRSSPSHPCNDPRYDNVARDLLPDSECLRDTLDRCLPFWHERVAPELRAGRNVLISAHGHSIRALVKALDGLSDDEIARVSMPNGIPLLYTVDADTLYPTPPARRSIDACGQPSPLNGIFLADDNVLSARLERDAAIVGLDCPLPEQRATGWVTPTFIRGASTQYASADAEEAEDQMIGEEADETIGEAYIAPEVETGERATLLPDLDLEPVPEEIAQVACDAAEAL